MLTFVNSEQWIHGCLLYYSCTLFLKPFTLPQKCNKYLTSCPYSKDSIRRLRSFQWGRGCIHVTSIMIQKAKKKKVVYVSCVCALFFWRGCDSISYKGIWKCMAGDLDLHKNLKSATGIQHLGPRMLIFCNLQVYTHTKRTGWPQMSITSFGEMFSQKLHPTENNR